MSFSKRCKKEVLKKQPINTMAELLSVVFFIGSIRISNKGYKILFRTYSNTEARYIYNLIKDCYDYSSTFEIKDIDNEEKERLFTVIIEENDISEDIIEKSDRFFINTGADLDDVSLEHIKAYLKIAFVFRGSVNDPQRGYNLEISVLDLDQSDLLSQCMDIFELNPKINKKKDSYIVYLKDSDKISDFLAIIEASKSLFELENVRAMKSIRNNINRQTNFDKANIDRTVAASVKQVDAINLLISAGYFDSLSEDMKEIASLRIDNPYASIEELGAMANPPMSKSKVNYRLQKFIKMAEELS
ncbi:DNA-binding protein WhiA [uncultured Anaerococcus sp.]|uniref:DNA-binding protein WhiA n=1 Tax=uncultured Anaerococcus sp. TaxID=293428 RepID=UPI002605B202|nr:DNA-binding protein WhiA [uncultured Anaerococcus sp.]